MCRHQGGIYSHIDISRCVVVHDVWLHLRPSSERGALRCAAAERELQLFARHASHMLHMYGMEQLQTYTVTTKLTHKYM